MLTSATKTQLDDSNKNHLVNNAILLTVLLDKGIITEEEVRAARPQARRMIDQLWEEKMLEGLLGQGKMLGQ